MSKGVRRPWTIRLSEEAHAFLDKAIEDVIATKGLSGQSARGDATIEMANFYRQGIQEKEIPRSIPDLEQRINCPYLRREGQNWVCDETFEKKRVSVEIGYDDDVVLAKCLAHKRKIQEIQNEKIRGILAKQTVAKAVDFYKKFMTIAEDGFGAGCFICTAMWVKEGISRISRDNKTIICHKRDESVNIKTVCQETINLTTKAPPCEFLFEFEHTVYFDEIKEFKEVDPEVAPTPCSAYGTSECPGADPCTEDLHALARMNSYCPVRASPKTGVPLLEEQEEPSQ